MIVQLGPDDTIIHQADVDHPTGVPAVWAIVVEGSDDDVFNVLFKEQDDAEPWYLHWRGSWETSVAQYQACVTEAMLGDLLFGLPTSRAAAIQLAEQEKAANRAA
jgi:hypothetical protein